MSGQELLLGFSFVDERFIAEAETAVLSRKVPWMKVLSAAACLCILVAGAFALNNLGLGAKEEAAAPAAPAPESMQESVTEAAAPTAPPAEECATEAAPATTASGELEHVPNATLRIEKVLEDGSFEAIVMAMEPMEMDTPVTLVIDPDMVPDGERIDAEYADTITENMVVEIHNGAYDAGINTLYVEGVFATEE